LLQAFFTELIHKYFKEIASYQQFVNNLVFFIFRRFSFNIFQYRFF